MAEQEGQRSVVLVKEILKEILDIYHRAKNLFEEAQKLVDQGKGKIKIQHPDIDPERIMKSSPADIETLAKIHGGGYADIRRAIYLSNASRFLERAGECFVFANYEETMRHKRFKIDLDQDSETHGALIAVLQPGERSPEETE